VELEALLQPPKEHATGPYPLLDEFNPSSYFTLKFLLMNLRVTG